MGGIGILLGLMVAGFLFSEIYNIPSIYPLLSIITIPFIIGLLDDLIHLKPFVKLAGQILAALLVYFVLDVSILSLFGLFGIEAIGQPIGFMLTIGTIIFVTNSFNLIDGIDGLAASIAIVILGCFGVWFFLEGSMAYALFAFALVGGIMAFLIKNWQPSKIFMGDTGSLLIGMSISILFIAFLNHNYALPNNDALKFDSSIVTGLGVIAVPLTDTIRIIVIRLAKGVSPLKADKRHIHHALVRLGRSHREAVLILVGLQLLVVTLVIALKSVSEVILFPAVIGVVVTFCIILDRMIHNHTFNKKTDEAAASRKALRE